MVDDTRALHLSLSNPTHHHVRNASPRSQQQQDIMKEKEREKGHTSRVSILMTIIAVIALMVFIIYYGRNLSKYLEYIGQIGLLGNLIVILSYIPAGLPFAIVSYYIPLSLSAGYVYHNKYYLSIPTAMIGSVLSGMLGFWVTRLFCRAWIEEKIKSSARLSALVLVMEVQAFKVTLMVRFLPLPFGLQNALCAMTSITSPKFLLSSLIGLLPENLLLVYFGNSLDTFEGSRGGFGSFPTHEKILMLVAVVGTCIIFVMGRRMMDATLEMARTGSSKKTEEDVALLFEDGLEKGNGKDGGSVVVELESVSSFGKEKDSTPSKNKDITSEGRHIIEASPFKQISKVSNLPDPPSNLRKEK